MRKLDVVLLALSMMLIAQVVRSEIDLTITSSADWRSSATFQEGWQAPDFDDSAWATARSPYPSLAPPTDLIPDTTAEFVWHDPDGFSDGTTGPNTAFLRVTFDLDLQAANAPIQAIASVSVDDDYDFYVNGELLLENHDNGFADVVDSIDFSHALKDGTNVIAIQAVDGGWDNPRDRGFERVLLEARITSLPRFLLRINSGSDWISNDTLEPGWQKVGFDDSAWPAARAPYPNPSAPQTSMADTLAQSIWHDPLALSDGTTGVNEAFFRYNFTLNFDPDTTPLVAQAKVLGDDDYSLYVNGLLVFENHDGGFSSVVDTIDFTYALREGDNVIAIQAVDGGWDNPRDRGFERILVDAVIATGELDWTFYKVADVGYFLVSDPALEGNTVVFMCFHFNCTYDGLVPGVYAVDITTGTRTTIAQDGTLLPDASGIFRFEEVGLSDNDRPSIDSGNIGFRGVGIDQETWEVIQQGVYTSIDGLFAAPATTTTPIPGGSGNFESFSGLGPDSAADAVVFQAEGSGEQSGVYSDVGGVLGVIADKNTLVPLPPELPPGAVGTFESFGLGPSLDEGKVAFWGSGPLVGGSLFDGIYLYDVDSSSFEIVADDITSIPGSADEFSSFFSPAYSEGQVAFWGEGPAQNGIYAWSDGVLNVIADTATPLPGGGGNFGGFGGFPSTDAGNVAFGTSDGIFTDLGGGLSQVVDAEVGLPEIFGEPGPLVELGLYHEALSGNKIAFRVVSAGEYQVYEAIVVAQDAFGFFGDSDGDGVADTIDNCTLKANPAQTDSNGDGFGNLCDADLNGDNVVNFIDLGEFKSVFFSGDVDADLNADGVVNFVDLGLLKESFFNPPGPSARAP